MWYLCVSSPLIMLCEVTESVSRSVSPCSEVSPCLLLSGEVSPGFSGETQEEDGEEGSWILGGRGREARHL